MHIGRVGKKLEDGNELVSEQDDGLQKLPHQKLPHQVEGKIKDTKHPKSEVERFFFRKKNKNKKTPK